MVRRFYADVAMDDLLGPVFNDVAHVDWPEHLQKLTAFWCQALLGLPGYGGNPFRAHALVHEQLPLTVEHFDRWLLLFHDTVELGWTGPNASRVTELACAIARVHSERLPGHAVSLQQTAGAPGHAGLSSRRMAASETGARVAGPTTVLTDSVPLRPAFMISAATTTSVSLPR